MKRIQLSCFLMSVHYNNRLNCDETHEREAPDAGDLDRVEGGEEVLLLRVHVRGRGGAGA